MCDHQWFHHHNPDSDRIHYLHEPLTSLCNPFLPTLPDTPPLFCHCIFWDLNRFTQYERFLSGFCHSASLFWDSSILLLWMSVSHSFFIWPSRLFIRGFSCPMVCGILVLWPGSQLVSPALEGRFLTPGSPGKSLIHSFLLPSIVVWMTTRSFEPFLPIVSKAAVNIPEKTLLAKSLRSCPTLWDPMVCSLPGSSAHEILQARILEWAAISFLTNHSHGPSLINCQDC